MKDHRKERAEAEGKMTVRLHTGDPCIYGAIREQMDILDEKNIRKTGITDDASGEGFPVKIRCCSREKTGCSGI